MTVEIHSEPVDSPEARELVREYLTDIVTRWSGRPATPDEVDAELAAGPGDDLAPPGGDFLVAREDGVALGCVGVRTLEPGTVEVKRMFVRPAARGRRVGHLLAVAAEEAARGLGAQRLRLDTRDDLVEARAVYAREGYREIPRYNDNPHAQVWFEKSLR